jgi:serine phosphatase RsbU (regulator of sigma subunit)
MGLGGSTAAIHDRVVREVMAFQGDAAAHDDRSLVVISRAAALPETPGTS